MKRERERERERKNKGREEVLVGKKKGCLQEASMRCSESDYNNNNHNGSTQLIFSCIYYVHTIYYVHAVYAVILFCYCSNSAGSLNSCLVLPASAWLLSASLLFPSSGFFSFLGCFVSTSIVTCMHSSGQHCPMPPSQSRIVPLLHNCGNINPPAHHSSIRRPSSLGIRHS